MTVTTLLPYLVLLAQIAFVFALIAIIFRNSWGDPVWDFIKKRTVLAGFLVVLASIIGSLYYSNVIGFAPCELCWWQRAFLYPEAVIFAVALWVKDSKVYQYIAPLAAIAFVISLYQSMVQWFPSASFLACTSAGSSCAKVYVNAFGYITIPVMSLTVAAWVLLLAWANRIQRKNEDSNA